MRNYIKPVSTLIPINLRESIASSGQAFRLRGWKVGDEDNALIDCGTSEEIIELIKRILAGE